MNFSTYLQLSLDHDYYGDVACPITVEPADPSATVRHDFRLRRTGNSIFLFGSDAQTPDRVSLRLSMSDQGFRASLGGSTDAKLVALHAPLGSDDLRFQGGTMQDGAHALEDPSTLGVLHAALDLPNTRNITLRFEAPNVIWTYFVVSHRQLGDLEVTENGDPSGFRKIEDFIRTDGKFAQSFQSLEPLPLRLHPTRQFALQRRGPNGPETLIQVLPSAGIDSLRPSVLANGEPGRECHVFVILG